MPNRKSFIQDPKSVALAILVTFGYFILYWMFLKPIVNDDTGVYLTYAIQMLEGRYFAYDIRDIPSEGYTSILYLLIITVLMSFGLHPFLSAVFINIFSVLLLPWIFILSVEKKFTLSNDSKILFITITHYLFINDIAVNSNIGFALETMFSSAVMLCFMMVFISEWLRTQVSIEDQKNFSWTLIITSVLSTLTRPENILFISLLWFFLLTRSRIYWRSVFATLFLLIIYNLWKYLIFGDIFPTGFYRKLNVNELLGLEYAATCYQNYSFWWLFALGILYFLYSTSDKESRKVFFITSIVFGALIAISFLNVTLIKPIIAYNCRYVIHHLSYVYIFLAFAAALFIQRIEILYKGYVVVLILSITLMSVTFINKTNTNREIYEYEYHLNKRVEEQWESHRYVEFGKFLRKALREEDKVTIVYGDAGLIPYYFRGFFIDYNGLTDTEIAKIFQISDQDEKARKMADYILSYMPDLLFGSVAENLSDTRIKPFSSEHDPFMAKPSMEYFRYISEAGYQYLCTLDLKYTKPVFFANRKSKNYRKISHAIIEFTNIYGGTCLDNGIKIVSNGKSIHFTQIMSYK